MSGNPFGLSEISHFGSFQRVGGKAGGFINKKFFHPSSIRNQEKLWKAQTADEREKKKQMDMDRRREEEKHVEEMRKQLYLAGQGTATDLFVRSGAAQDDESRSSNEISEQKAAVQEQRRRRALLKEGSSRQQGGVDEAASDEEEAPPALGTEERTFTKSRYREDNFVQGHCAVWGSWYSKEDDRWGYCCCKGLEHGAKCPLAPAAEELPASEAAAEKGRPRGKRRRQGEGGGGEGEQQGEAAAGLQGGGRAAGAGTPGEGEQEPLMDMRMFEAAERRRERKREEEKRKEEAKKSGYLGRLLSSPTT